MKETLNNMSLLAVYKVYDIQDLYIHKRNTVIQGTVPKWWQRSGFMFCPNASASADAGCCVNKYTTFLWRRNYFIQAKLPGCPGKQEEYEERKYFLPCWWTKGRWNTWSRVTQKQNGIMFKAWNNLITEQIHQPSNTFKAEKYFFWSCPGRLMQWCKIMWVCRTAMKIQFKIQFTIFPIFLLLKRKIKPKQPFN